MHGGDVLNSRAGKLMNQDLYQALKARVTGEVRFDRASRLMYSTDASIKKLMNQDLYQALKARVTGEVRFDRASRLMYSTDASIYEIEPIGVVIPRNREDVFATMEIARDFKAPVLPRGAGTSLAGQTVGEAVVIDMSKYLNRVLGVNTEEGWALVEPGVVQEH